MRSAVPVAIAVSVALCAGCLPAEFDLGCSSELDCPDGWVCPPSPDRVCVRPCQVEILGFSSIPTEAQRPCEPGYDCVPDLRNPQVGYCEITYCHDDVVCGFGETCAFFVGCRTACHVSTDRCDCRTNFDEEDQVGWCARPEDE